MFSIPSLLRRILREMRVANLIALHEHKTGGRGSEEAFEQVKQDIRKIRKN